MPDFFAFFAAAMIVVFHSVNAFHIADNSKISFPLAPRCIVFLCAIGVHSDLRLSFAERYSSNTGLLHCENSENLPGSYCGFSSPVLPDPSGGWVWNGSREVAAANLLLVHGWIPMASYYFSFNSVSWTISTEAFFYLVFPFLICRLDRSWCWKLVCTFLFVAAVLSLTDFFKLSPYDANNLSAITAHGLAYISPLVIGALVATLLSGFYGTRWICSLFDVRSQYAFVVYAGACASFPAFGILIGVLSFERGIISRFLSAGWLTTLGEISYSMYLVHWTVIHWYSLNRSKFTSLPKTVLYIAFWLAVLSLSFIIWRVVEKPCQRGIRSLFGSKRGTKSMNAEVATIIKS